MILSFMFVTMIGNRNTALKKIEVSLFQNLRYYSGNSIVLISSTNIVKQIKSI